jgi:hypothetical protein
VANIHLPHSIQTVPHEPCRLGPLTLLIPIGSEKPGYFASLLAAGNLGKGIVFEPGALVFGDAWL